jgi:hypothetical protein
MPITKASSNAVAPAAKGDLVVGNATNDSGVLAVGANNTVLTADSAETTGLKWATPAAGSLTLLSTTALSGTTTTISSISQSYKHLQILIENAYLTSSDQDTFIRLNGDSGNNYSFGALSRYNPNNAWYQTKVSLMDHTVNNSGNPTKDIRSVINIYRYTNTDAVFGNISSTSFYPGTGQLQTQYVIFTYDCSAAITSISILGDVAFTGGTAYVYGVN